jgi:hypothetical protein
MRLAVSGQRLMTASGQIPDDRQQSVKRRA